MKNNREKLLHLIPNLGTGGAQRVFSQLTNGLLQYYQVDLYTFNSDTKEVYAKELNIRSLYVSASSNIFQKIWHLLLRIRKLKNIKKSNNYCITISHLEGADFINVLTGRNDKKIIVLHGSKLADIKYKGIYHFFRHKVLVPYSLKKADKIVCVSKGISNEIIKFYNAPPEKIEVIYNFFDHDAIIQLSNAAIQERDLELILKKYPVLINCARLDIQKNQYALLDVMLLIIKEAPDVKLFLVGDGDMREELILYSRALGVKTWIANEGNLPTSDYNIFFLGNKENPFPFIRKSKLFLLTSGWEGFPLSIGESMICGTPVMSSDCPTGPREILAPDSLLEIDLQTKEYAEFGILMPLLDRKKLLYKLRTTIWKDAICELLKKPEVLKEYSVKGQKRAKDFSKEKILSQWLNLIRSYTKSSLN